MIHVKLKIHVFSYWHFLKERKQENKKRHFQLGENFPCANPDMAQWSPMPGFDQTNGHIATLTVDIDWEPNPAYDSKNRGERE